MVTKQKDNKTVATKETEKNTKLKVASISKKTPTTTSSATRTRTVVAATKQTNTPKKDKTLAGKTTKKTAILSSTAKKDTAKDSAKETLETLNTTNVKANTIKTAISTSNIELTKQGTINKNDGFVEEYHGLILPSLRELEIYEQRFPGSAQKILEMGKLEQRHRHRLQDKYAMSYNLTYRLGQFFGLLYAIVILLAVLRLTLLNKEAIAITLLGMNLALIALGIITNTNYHKYQRLRRIRNYNHRTKQEN